MDCFIMEMYPFIVGYFSCLIMVLSRYLLEIRKPMKCLKTFSMDCDNCHCWTCPRYGRKEALRP